MHRPRDLIAHVVVKQIGAERVQVARQTSVVAVIVHKAMQSQWSGTGSGKVFEICPAQAPLVSFATNFTTGRRIAYVEMK